MSAGPSAGLPLSPRVTPVATLRLPTRHGHFDAHAYRDEATGAEHLVLVMGELGQTDSPVLVRLHQECPDCATPHPSCDCGDRLDAAQAAVAAEGRGAVVWLRGRPEYGAAEAALLHLGLTIPGGEGRAADDGWSALLAGRVPAGGPLAERYGPLVAAGPRLVLAQLGQSLDGFIAARTGDARFVTGEADRAHLHRLRALVDAVLVGVGTVLADDCRLTVRAVAGPQPVRVLLDPDGRAPRDAHMLAVPDAPTLWVVADDRAAPTPPSPHVEVLPLPRDGRARDFAPARLLSTLAGRGLGRVLVEGGGVTVSRFLSAGALDRLLLTTAPVLVGDGVPGLRFEGHDRLADALRAPSRRFVSGEDVNIELDLAQAARNRAGQPGDGQGEEARQH